MKNNQILDARSINLHKCRKQEMEDWHPSAYREEKIDDSKGNPTFAPFYDITEPTWMLKVGGEMRMFVYEYMIYGCYNANYHPSNHFGLFCVGYIGVISLCNAVIHMGSKLLPKSYEHITYCVLAAFNLPAIIYIGHAYYNNIQDRKAIQSCIDHYKDKSMQYILRDAYGKHSDWLHKTYVPDAIESVQGQSTGPMERSAQLY